MLRTLGSLTILVAPETGGFLDLGFDATGVAVLPIARDPALSGLTGYAQALAAQLSGATPAVSATFGLRRTFP